MTYVGCTLGRRKRLAERCQLKVGFTSTGSVGLAWSKGVAWSHLRC